MRGSVALLAFGPIIILSAVVTGELRERTQADDRRGVARLQEMLDSTRAALGAATNAVDSARLGREVTEREFYLGRRTFHIPHRQEMIDGWWTPRGVGAQLVILGVLCIALGGAMHVKNRRPEGTSP